MPVKGDIVIKCIWWDLDLKPRDIIIIFDVPSSKGQLATPSVHTQQSETHLLFPPVYSTVSYNVQKLYLWTLNLSLITCFLNCGDDCIFFNNLVLYYFKNKIKTYK